MVKVKKFVLVSEIRTRQISAFRHFTVSEFSAPVFEKQGLLCFCGQVAYQSGHKFLFICLQCPRRPLSIPL